MWYKTRRGSSQAYRQAAELIQGTDRPKQTNQYFKESHPEVKSSCSQTYFVFSLPMARKAMSYERTLIWQIDRAPLNTKSHLPWRTDTLVTVTLGN